MKTLILVRHGESAANGKGFFAGQLDIPLSDRGKEQARRVADYIKKNYHVDKIYSSDLSRAYDTAKAIAETVGLEIETEEKLREIYSGDWQGRTFDELQEQYADTYGVWLTDIGNAVCPNGETVKELYQRIFFAVSKIAKENREKTIVVVTHATPIRALCCRMKGFSVKEMKNVPWVSNASLTVLQFEEDEFSLVEEDVCEHLSDLKTRFPSNV